MKDTKYKYRKKAKRQALERHRTDFLKREGLSEREVRVRSDGEVKISKILEEFASPCLSPDFDKDQLYSALMISVIAWNISMMPRDEAAEFMEQAMATVGSSNEKVRGIIDGLVQRKKMFFSQYKALILDLQVTDLGDGYHISVMTVPYEKEQNDFLSAR